MKQGGPLMYVFCTFLIILILFLFIALITNGKSECDIYNNLDKNDVDSFVHNYLRTTEAKNPRQISNFFANNAVLFPLLSGKFINNSDNIFDYFAGIQKSPNFTHTILSRETKKIDNRTWGYYAFVNISDNSQPSVKVRMTFIIKAHHNDRLKISLLHCSTLP
jgi:hypothetical protein